MKTSFKLYSFVQEGTHMVPVSLSFTRHDSGIGIHITGIPDQAIKESLLRAVTALNTCGVHLPSEKIELSISRIDGKPILYKCDILDLPIAVGLWKTIQRDPTLKIDSYPAFAGELGLYGSLRPVCHEKLKSVWARLVLPEGDKGKCSGPNIIYAKDLNEVAQYLNKNVLKFK